jgi:hypothetical protein
MSRFVFGPAIGPVELLYIPPAEPGVKVDVEVAFAGFTPDGEFHFELPAYDPAANNLLAAVHVVLVADGTPVPTDPAAAVASPTLPHYSTDTSTLQAGGPVTVDATEADAGHYTALAILEFES